MSSVLLPARRHRWLVVLLAGVLALAGAAWYLASRQSALPTEPDATVPGSAAAARSRPRPRNRIPARPANRRGRTTKARVVDKIKRTFLGKPGWLVIGHERFSEDEAMWAARQREDQGVEATAVKGDLFTNLDADDTYLVYGGFTDKDGARDRIAELKKRGIHAKAVESGPVRPAEGTDTAPARLTAIRGLVTDDGQPAAYHVERRLESAAPEDDPLGAVMPDAQGRFLIWTNRVGSIALIINLPLELDDFKSAEGAWVDIDESTPPIIDVALEVQTKKADSQP